MIHEFQLSTSISFPFQINSAPPPLGASAQFMLTTQLILSLGGVDSLLARLNDIDVQEHSARYSSAPLSFSLPSQAFWTTLVAGMLRYQRFRSILHLPLLSRLFRAFLPILLASHFLIFSFSPFSFLVMFSFSHCVLIFSSCSLIFL